MDVERACLLPSLHESPNLTGTWKPDHDMYVVRHHYKPVAIHLLTGQSYTKRVDDNPLCRVMIQQSPPMVTRKGDEVCVSPLVMNCPEHEAHPLFSEVVTPVS